MKNQEVMGLSNQVQQTGQTVFRTILGRVKDLPLSLAIIENNKKIKEKAESLREVLKDMEPKAIKDLREKQDDESKQKLEELYTEFINRKDVQDFLKSEFDVEFKRCTLQKKYVDNAGFDTDQVELLMLFTNIAELYVDPEPLTEKPTKKKKV